jgi:hypothetical protein
MTNSELKEKLLQAQALLSEVYDWAKQPHTKYTGTEMNSEIAWKMSGADSRINDALKELE